MAARDAFLAELLTERTALLARLEQALCADARVTAAWLGGSMGRGDGDALSDLDIGLAIVDEHCPDLVAQRRAFVSQFGEALLIQEAPHNAPPNGAFLLVLYRGTTAAHEVDWSWQPPSTTRVPGAARLLFDRVGLPRAEAFLVHSDDEAAAGISVRTTFIWAMGFVVAKKIARGHTTAAFDLLRMMRNAQDLVRAGLEHEPLTPWGGLNRPVGSEVLPPLEPAAQLAYLRALLAEMATLQPTTDGPGGLMTTDAAAAINQYIDSLHT
jgi:hypothetical protein